MMPVQFSIIMRAAAIAALLSTPTGCDAVKQDTEAKPATYLFILGPKPELTKGIDKRIEVRMPSKYIALDGEKTKMKHIESGQFTFAVHFPDGEPVPRDQLARSGVVIVSAIWEQVGAVARRVNGSWLNYYSRYQPTGDTLHGLKVLRPSEVNHHSILLISDDNNTIVECQQIASHKAMPCDLLYNSGENLTIEAVFDPSLLPRWSDIRALGENLISNVKPHQGV